LPIIHQIPQEKLVWDYSTTYNKPMSTIFKHNSALGSAHRESANKRFAQKSERFRWPLHQDLLFRHYLWFIP